MKHSRAKYLRCISASFLLAISFSTALPGAAKVAGKKSSSSVARPPNIVLILADDFGYECVGANGGTSYRTPAIDQLAATGRRFDRGYMLPSCSPTRVQLMTGLSGKRNYLFWARIDPQSTTFATLLRDAGYATGMVGKWQLGQDPALPKKVGFDEHCLWQHTRIVPRYANPGIETNSVARDYTNGEYGPDIVGDYALDFIERKKDRPFLLYYSMILVHSPFQPTPDSKSWDPKAIGESVNRKPAHLAEMIAYMDKQVGKVVAKLDALGLRENTLILFTGDNGTTLGTRSMMGDKVVVGGKGTTTDAGMRVPLIANWPGKIQPGTSCNDLIDSTDFLATLAEVGGVKLPANLKLDGRSFYPQILGQPGHPREWIYSWYSTRKNDTKDLEAKECAYNHHYRLYANGKFYDLRRDLEEKDPLEVTQLHGEAASAARLLRGALDQFKDIRPAQPTFAVGRNVK